MDSVPPEMDDARLFYAKVGWCVTQWAYIERELYLISRWALGANDTVASFVFYQWSSLENKLAYVDGLVARTAQKAHRGTWASIAKKIYTLKGDRNFLVHQPAVFTTSVNVHLTPTGFGGGEVTGSGWEISTEPFQVVAGARKQRSISLFDLTKHQDELDVLAGEIAVFTREISRSRRRLAKSAPLKEPRQSARARTRRANSQARKRQRTPPQA